MRHRFTLLKYLLWSHSVLAVAFGAGLLYEFFEGARSGGPFLYIGVLGVLAYSLVTVTLSAVYQSEHLHRRGFAKSLVLLIPYLVVSFWGINFACSREHFHGDGALAMGVFYIAAIDVFLVGFFINLFMVTRAAWQKEKLKRSKPMLRRF